MPKRLKYYFDKLLAFLRVRPLVVGLEVSDAVLRLAYFDGNAWHLKGVRLTPGTIEAGKIKNHDQFVAALKELRSWFTPGQEAKIKVNAVVSLSSISIYSQVFSLPIIEGERLDKAIRLNVQVVSPVEISQAYSGWQKVGEDQESLRLEILSAFIDRSTVDELSRVLFEAGFLAVVIESHALSIARIFREQASGVDAARSYVAFGMDNSGLDFLIIRRGQLYFEYFVPWSDVADEKGQISVPLFEAAIIRSLHRVINFYSQHWPDPLAGIVFSAVALKDESVRIIKDNFSLTVTELKLRLDQSIGPEWFVSLGCGLRGLKPRRRDKEMSLLGIGAEEEFWREQLLNFSRLWRTLIPVSLGTLLASFILAGIFLVQTQRSLEAQTLFKLSEAQDSENRALQVKAAEFNKEVSFVGNIEKSAYSRSKFLDKFNQFLRGRGVIVNRFSFGSPDGPIVMSGEVQSEADVADFKKAMDGNPEFKEVSVPLSDIKQAAGRVSFSVSFKLVQ